MTSAPRADPTVSTAIAARFTRRRRTVRSSIGRSTLAPSQTPNGNRGANKFLAVWRTNAMPVVAQSVRFRTVACGTGRPGGI
jgi:hypothetical protein